MPKRMEFLVLMAGLAATGTLAWFNTSLSTNTAQVAFERLAGEDVLRLERRMAQYRNALIATSAFVKSDAPLQRASFDQFVDNLDITNTLPGIKGIGMIEAVNADQIAPLERRMRAEGYKDVSVYPVTDGPQKLVITRVSPLAPNAAALGLDISFEQGRKTAAENAHAMQLPQLTATLTLVQDQKKEAGFLLLLPQNADKPARWIYAPFVARDLFNADGFSPNTQKPYVMEVFDAPRADADARIYDSSQRSAPDVLASNPVTGAYQYNWAVHHFGRRWLMQFKSTDYFDAPYRTYSWFWILAAGSLLTVMLVNVLRNMRLRNTATAELNTIREREIKAQELENRSIIENAVTPFFILDSNDKILFANQAAHTCFEYPDGGLDGQAFADLVHQPTSAQTHPRGITKSGKNLTLDLQRNNWSTSQGDARTTAIVRDVTAERDAQRAISHTKTLYDLALQGSQIGVFDRDLETGTSEVSDTWHRIMGRAPDNRLGDAQALFVSRVHPDDMPIIQAADAACIAGQTDRSMSEFRLQTLDGRWRWMRSDAVVSKRAADGRALHLIGTQIDITEIRKAYDALETSERLFRQVLAAAPIGTVILNTAGHIISSNPAFRELVGLPTAAQPSDHSIYDFVAQADVKTIFTQMADLGHHDSAEPYQAEYPLNRIDGTHALGLFHISLTQNNGANESDIYIVQIIDITEQRRVQSMKDEFVSTVSHELRTPLTSIKGALGLLTIAQTKGDTAGTGRLIEIASTNAQRLTEIINDILDIEQINTGSLRFVTADTDLHALVKQAVAALQPYAHTHKNTLVLALPDPPLFVVADASRTRQVLENLISNACKFSDVETAIHICARHEKGYVKVQVQNTGAGVPDAFQDRLFNAFTQADGSATRATGGTGLGLHISQQIVHQQGGEIGFDTEPPDKTTFWFTIPAVNASPALAADDPPTHPTPSNARPSVLHIEADRDFAEVIHNALSPHADITHAASLTQALSAIHNLFVDTVLIDWALPEGDASALLTQLQSIHPQARIIGLCADDERPKDPRLTLNFIKTRTELSSIINAVLNQQPEAT